MASFIRRDFIPVLSFLMLLLFTIPFSFDIATSVVPGWHTTIFPPYFAWTVVVGVCLLFVTIGYWLLSKRVDTINWTVFAIHIILTIPAIIFIKLPVIFLDVNHTNQLKLIKELSFRMKLIPAAWAVFAAGQILFLIYYVTAIKVNRSKT